MNSKYLIKTTNGFKEFDGIVKSPDKEGLKIYFDDNSFISVTKNHRFVDKELKLAQDLKVNDIINNKKIIKIENIISEFYDPFGVHGDNTYLVNGLNNHNCNIILIDECVEYNETIILQFNNKNLTIKIGDFYKIYDKNIKYKVKTSNGFKKFDDIKETYSKENIKIYFDNNSIIVTPNHKFYINNSFVYAKDLKINDEILFNNNIEKITKIEKDVSCSNKFYDLINVDAGHHYNASGFEVSNCAFINSNMFNEFMDSVAPSQSALSFKQMIMISTANGRNHFYDF